MKPFAIRTRTGERKGKTFRAILGGSLYWNALRLGRQNDSETAQPIWSLWLGSHHELRAFLQNLRMGREAVSECSSTTPLTLNESVPYVVRWRGTDAVEIFAETPFSMKPVVTDPQSRFVLSPPTAWVERQGVDTEDAIASLFAAYLDQRTAVPILRIPAFHRALYDHAIGYGFLVEADSAYRSLKYTDGLVCCEGFAALPFAAALRFCKSGLDGYIVERTEAFLKENPHHGTPSILGPRGILSDAPNAGRQMCIFPAA